MGTLQRIVLVGLVLVVVGQARATVQAAEPLFSFGELRELQTLPEQAKVRPLDEAELILYENMEFYTFTAFEALLAANVATMSIGGPPLFCAPAGTFSFEDGGDVAVLLAELTGNLLALVDDLGGPEDHYDRRPASEALLFALRATFPCEREFETVSALR